MHERAKCSDELRAGSADKRAGRARTSAKWAARARLVKDMNCATATLEAVQDVFGVRDDLLLRCVTGLEGGVVAGGSTCGVITGGSLGMAQVWEKATRRDPASSPEFMALVRRYVEWFARTFGTTLCSERTGIDFYTTAGQVRYFLPGDRVLRCISHIGSAVAYLREEAGRFSEDARSETGVRGVRAEGIGCATTVLANVRLRTGLGDPRIERAAGALSGGVGLSGGVCGALVGAVMGINLLVGMDVRRMNRLSVMRDFAVGHVNLLLRRPRWMPEPFGIGREIVCRFSEQAPSRQCRLIVGREFSSPARLSAFLSSSPTCSDLIAVSSNLACAAIERWR